jgi:ferritin-like metal-binding protein YciE
MKRNSNINNTNNFNTKNTSAINGIITGQLMKLFEDEIRELISTEKELTKVIPVFIKNTTSIKLIESLTENLNQSNLHVGRLAKVFG